MLQINRKRINLGRQYGAPDGSRTRMGLASTRRPPESKSGASTEFRHWRIRCTRLVDLRGIEPPR